MKQARFKLFETLEYRSDCDLVNFHIVNFRCVVRFVTFDFIVMFSIVKIFTSFVN